MIMKKSRFLFFFLLLTSAGVMYAQEKIPLIRPGQGISEVLIGMKMSEVERILGKPNGKYSFKEEKRGYVNFGYDPNDYLVFRNGFDLVCTYDNSSNKAGYPVFKIYYKKKKVCYIILSAAGYDNAAARNFKTDRGPGLRAEKAEVLKAFGDPTRVNKMEGYDGEYVYEKDGISFVVEKDGTVISIDIFPPK